MKIKAVLDTLDGLDEGLKQYYTEQDGKFYLSLEGVQDHTETKALKNALDRVRDEKKAVTTELDTLKDKYGSLPDDFNLEEYNRLMDGGKGDVDERLKEQRERLTKQFETEKEKLVQERDKWKGGYETKTKSDALNAAIAEMNIAKQFVPAVKAMFERKINVAHEGENIVTTIDAMPVKDALKAWADSEDGKHYVAAPANGGGGSGGSGGSGKTTINPWSKETRNLTEQMRITQEDPEKAKRLKAEAK